MKRIIILQSLFYLCNSVSISKVGEEKDYEALRSFFSGRSLKSNETSSIIEILRYIKTTIEDKNNSALSKQWETKFEMVSAKNDRAVAALKEQLDTLSMNTKQKVDIMIENISSLRMLLVELDEQIKMVVERMENIEDGLMPNRDKASVDRMDIPPIRPLANFIQYSDSKPLNSHLISDILSVSPKSPQIKPLISEIVKKKSDMMIKQEEKDTVESLTEKVNQLRSAVTLLNVNSGSHDVQITELLKSTDNRTKGKEPQSLCSCPNETFEKILQSLNTEFVKVQDSKNDISKYQNEIKTLKLQVQALEDNYKLVSKNVSSFQMELNKMELSRVDLSSPSTDITDIKDQLQMVSKTLTGVMKMVETGLPATPTITNQKILCVHPYKSKADGCFHVIDNRRLSWKEARTACKEIQGDLAAPRNFTEFRNYLLDLKLSRSYTFWVGGSDEEQEDKWIWVDGRNVNMSEEVWESGQPNQGKSNNCMEIRPNVRYVASDQRCESRKFFICQQLGS